MNKKEGINNRFLDAAQRRALGGFSVTDLLLLGMLLDDFWDHFECFLYNFSCSGLSWALLGFLCYSELF